MLLISCLIFRGVGGGRFELIEFLQQGCGAAPQFDVGLGRRNNELHELTNCRAARVRRFELIEFLQRGCGTYGRPCAG